MALAVRAAGPSRGTSRVYVVLADALKRVAATADIVGVRALLIHCENEKARDFHLALARFDPSPTDPLHLLLLIKDLRASLAGPDDS